MADDSVVLKNPNTSDATTQVSMLQTAITSAITNGELSKANGLLKTLESVLRSLGKTTDEIRPMFDQLNVSGKDMVRSLALSKNALTDIARLPIANTFSELGTALKDMSAALDIGAVYEAVKIIGKIDSAFAGLNKTLLGIAQQSRTLAGVSGSGGMATVNFKGGQKAEDALTSAYFQLAKMNVGKDEIDKAIPNILNRLPRNAAAMEPGGIFHTAVSMQNLNGVNAETSTDLLVNLMRRIDTSGKSLPQIFDQIYKSVGKTNLTTQEGFDSFSQLWNATRLYGGSLAESRGLLEQFGDALQHGTVTAERLGALQGNQSNAKSSSILALATMEKSLGLKRSPLFAGASDNATPEELIGAYTKNTMNGKMSPTAQLKAVTDILHAQASRMGQKSDLGQSGDVRLLLEGLAPGLGLSLSPTEFQQDTQGQGFRGMGIPGYETLSSGKRRKVGIDRYKDLRSIANLEKITSNLNHGWGESNAIGTRAQELLDEKRNTPLASEVGNVASGFSSLNNKAAELTGHMLSLTEQFGAMSKIAIAIGLMSKNTAQEAGSGTVAIKNAEKAATVILNVTVGQGALGATTSSVVDMFVGAVKKAITATK